MGVPTDIAVLGSGPAALSIGAAAARLGCGITIIAPDPRATWRPNYCLWADEVPARLLNAIERSWDSVLVATDKRAIGIDRPYVKLDGAAVADAMWRDLRAAGARVVDGRATTIEHDSEGSTILLANGSVERARVVVDASGASTPFVQRESRRAAAHQVAYGVLLEAPGHRFDTDQAVLMDFRAADPDDNEPPSFLYALPRDDRTLFVEETSLAHRPAVSFEMLARRLRVRLDAWHLSGCRVLDEEWCSIPMGVPLPDTEQRVVPFGAAASMVNPASGYSVAHAFRKAEPTARAIAHALATAGPLDAVQAGNAAVWPAADRRAWELYAMGLESLVNMNAARTSAFFDGFFAMPQEDWSRFLAGTLSAREVVGIMARVFKFVPPSVGWHLVRTSLSTGFAPLAKLFLQPGTA